jgi:hypothetical protein
VYMPSRFRETPTQAKCYRQTCGLGLMDFQNGSSRGELCLNEDVDDSGKVVPMNLLRTGMVLGGLNPPLVSGVIHEKARA